MNLENNKSTHKYRWTLLLELIVGIVFLGTVFWIAVNVDMNATRKKLSTTITYIKEQYNQHQRLNLASETKSAMRMMENAQQISRILSKYSVRKRWNLDESLLQRCVEETHSSGMLLLDKSGTVKQMYGTQTQVVEELQADLDSEALLATATHLEKTYAARHNRDDGSYVDYAAVGLSDESGIVVAYYYTPLPYVQAFSNSVESLLSGYSLERDGTIVISDGKDIIASNNESLIGKTTDDIAILRKIRQNAKSDQLVHTNKTKNSVSQNFGLMQHGRSYYIYAYMPESDVFKTTFQNLVYSLIVYIIILIVVNTVRWKTAQSYREQQLVIQQGYTERLQNKNELLRKALDEADRANAAKTSFLSRMSHDIRTPLNGIIGLMEIDELHPDNTKLHRENHKKMKISANHLLSLINDVLQMSKLESGEVVLSHETIVLSELSKDVLTIVERRAADAGITLEYNRSEERIAVPNVYGSPLHLRQIFLNIYGNCIKYNKVGGKVYTDCTLLGIEHDIVTYRWTIEDTGIGMSEDFLQKIFEPFSQERIDARSVYNGTGLGMSIVKGLIEKMNGTIEVSSSPGDGTKFVITLPFEISEEEPSKLSVTQQSAPKVCRETTTRHLLLVEDNDLNAEIAETLLQDNGFRVTRVYDGKQALELFCAEQPRTFDAILMDVMMPVMDGITATRNIRALEREDAKQIPIIAMTANAFDEDVERQLEAGMNAHLSKPLQLNQLINMLNHFLDK